MRPKLRSTARPDKSHFLITESVGQLPFVDTAKHDYSTKVVLLRCALKIAEGCRAARSTSLAVLLNPMVELLFAGNYFAEVMDYCQRAIGLVGGNSHAVTTDLMRTGNN